MRGKVIYVMPTNGLIRIYSAVKPFDVSAGEHESTTELLEIEEHGRFLKEQTVERIRRFYEGGNMQIPFET